jgi:hypothetical protein
MHAQRAAAVEGVGELPPPLAEATLEATLGEGTLGGATLQRTQYVSELLNLMLPAKVARNAPWRMPGRNQTGRNRNVGETLRTSTTCIRGLSKANCGRGGTEDGIHIFLRLLVREPCL